MVSRIHRGARLAVLSLGTMIAFAARAGEPETPGGRGSLSFVFENDTFVDTDRYYTSGQRLAWQSAGLPGPLAAVGKRLAPYLLPEAPVQWGVAVGQSIYTSRKRLTPNPPRDDRPYAGTLYGTLALSSMTAEALGTVELSLGVIGPASGAESVQDFVHDSIEVEKLRGWDRQIGNRPAGLLSLERRWQRNASLAGGLELGIVPAVGLNLGNVQTSGAVGLLVRVGYQLSIDFGPPRMRPALSGLGVFRRPEGFAGYVFAGAEGRAVAYDETIDGNRHGYWRVDREPWVGELPFGLELAYGPARLGFAWVIQSETFEEQVKSPFRFGSASFSLAF